MRNLIHLEPIISSNDVLAQFTQNIKLDKNVIVTVPAEFFAYIFIDEKVSARLDAGSNINLLKYVGKKYIDSNIKLAFVRKNNLPYISWGFGDIAVKNEKLDETYRIGANGKYLLKLKDASLLIKAFGTDENINLEMVSEKTKEIIKTVGKPILSKYFANTSISVFEINSKIDEIREMMNDEIKKEKLFKDIGLELYTLTVNGIHVNDEDMELIRNRINKTNDDCLTVSNLDVIKKEIIESIKKSLGSVSSDELQNLKNQITLLAESYDTDTVIDEIDNLRVEMIEAIAEVKTNNSGLSKDELSKQLDEFKDEIYSNKLKTIDEYKKETKKMIDELDKKLTYKLDSSLVSIKSILENSIDEDTQKKLPLYETAKEQRLKDLVITTDLQLEKAENDDDYACVAGLIYSNVESNLINKFKISHKGFDFYMTEEEFNKIANTVLIDEKPLFRESFKCRYLNYPDLNGKFVEMPLEIRFIKAGLSVEEACQAAKDWTIINKLRHRSDENKRIIEDVLRNRKLTKKEFLRYVIDSYRNLGLYTRD